MEIGRDKIFLAVERKAPKYVVSGLLNRWCGMRGEAMLDGKCLKRVTEDNEIFNWGIAPWIGTERKTFRLDIESSPWMETLVASRDGLGGNFPGFRITGDLPPVVDLDGIFPVVSLVADKGYCYSRFHGDFWQVLGTFPFLEELEIDLDYFPCPDTEFDGRLERLWKLKLSRVGGESIKLVRELLEKSMVVDLSISGRDSFGVVLNVSDEALGRLKALRLISTRTDLPGVGEFGKRVPRLENFFGSGCENMTALARGMCGKPLTRLCLRQCSLDIPVLQEWIAGTSATLCELDLSSMAVAGPAGQEFWDIIASLGNLRELCLSANRLSAESLEKFGSVLSGNFRQLHSLDLCVNSFGASGYQVLDSAIDSTCFPELRKLNVNYTDLKADGARFLGSILEKLPTLSTVHLGRVESGIESLAAPLANLANLRCMSVKEVDGTNLKPAFEHFRRTGGSKSIRVLRLFECRKCIQHVASLISSNSLPNLRILEIPWNNMTTADFIILARALRTGNTPHLERIDLDGNEGSSAGYLALGTAITHLPSLTSIKCAGVSSFFINEL